MHDDHRRRRFLGKLTTLSLAKPKVVGLIATTRFEGLDVYCVIEWLKKISDPPDPPDPPYMTPYRPLIALKIVISFLAVL